MNQISKRTKLYFRWFNAIGIITAAIFGYLNILIGTNIVAGYLELLISALATLNLIVVIRYNQYPFGVNFLLFLMHILLVSLSITGGLGGTGIVWYFTYPVLAFGLQSSLRAIIWIGALIATTLTVSLYQHLSGMPTAFSLLDIQQLSISLIVVSALQYLYKSQQEFEESQLAEKIAEISLINNILEHEQVSESNLQQELLRFKLAVEHAQDMIVITDKDGYILYANPALERTTGFSNSEALGVKAGVLWGNQMPKSFYKNLWQTIKVEKKAYIGDFQNIRKNGQKYIAKATINPILDLSNEVQYFVGVERDVTKEKELEESKNEFLSFATHQLRTPITSLNWYADILTDGTVGVLTPQQSEVAQKIRSTVLRIQELTHEFLNISRIESGRFIIHPQPTNLRELFYSVIEETKHYLELKHQNIKIISKEQSVTVTVDPAILRQIIINLITNASKYSPEYSEININCYPTPDGHRLEVQDHGIGISTDDQTQIFSKFYRANNARESTVSGNGLGLFFIKKVIELVGGEVSFTSEIGKGTTFYITIPNSGWKEYLGQEKTIPET